MPSISAAQPHPKADVSGARAQLEQAKAKRDQSRQAARKDGRNGVRERDGLEDAVQKVRVARAELQLERSRRARDQVSADAFSDGVVTPKEQAALDAAKAQVRERRAEVKTLRLARPGTLGGATDLVISSFNITGSSHTGKGSSHPNLESGVKRMKYVTELIQKHKVDVVGFQELQGDQLKSFHERTDNKFGVYPGVKLGKRESVNSIAWRKEEWSLVKADSIRIPYFNGTRRPMPVVLLQNKQTGQKAWFTNFHNPADTKRFKNQERFRDAATKLQVQLVNRLRNTTGYPVFLTGDMNENAEYHQKMTKGSELRSSHTGENGKRPNKTGIDWIFGSRDVRFSGYHRDRSDLVCKTTNHPMVVSKARIRADRA